MKILCTFVLIALIVQQAHGAAIAQEHGYLINRQFEVECPSEPPPPATGETPCSSASDVTCASDVECDAGFVCVKLGEVGVCLLEFFACSGGRKCADGYVCSGGVCAFPTCEKKSDCLLSQGFGNCCFSTCLPVECGAQGECPEGTQCVNGTNICARHGNATGDDDDDGNDGDDTNGNGNGQGNDGVHNGEGIGKENEQDNNHSDDNDNGDDTNGNNNGQDNEGFHNGEDNGKENGQNNNYGDDNGGGDDTNGNNNGQGNDGVNNGKDNGKGNGQGNNQDDDDDNSGNVNNADSSQVSEDECFPADSTVELESGEIKRISDLSIGERVRVSGTSAAQFSRVFMFTHRVSNIRAEFITLKTRESANITLTPGHYIYANDRLVAARKVSPGDRVELGNGKMAYVTEVSTSFEKGLYNPQTMHGDIVVNGIKASTYTTTVQHASAHALLSPLRCVYSALGATTTLLENGANCIPNLVPRGQEIA